MFEGLDTSIQLANKQEFLTNVNDWIEDQTQDEEDEAFKQYLRELYFSFWD